jgi:hypothetical protein
MGPSVSLNVLVRNNLSPLSRSEPRLLSSSRKLSRLRSTMVASIIHTTITLEIIYERGRLCKQKLPLKHFRFKHTKWQPRELSQSVDQDTDFMIGFTFLLGERIFLFTYRSPHGPTRPHPINTEGYFPGGKNDHSTPP